MLISYLSGKLIWWGKMQVIIDVNGVGYLVNYYNEFTTSDYGRTLELYLTHKITDYDEVLYGFETMEEKNIFEILENIKGVGSKAIFNLLGFLNIKQTAELLKMNLNDLTNVPGVGKASAQKILLGISNKFKKDLDVKELLEERTLENDYRDEVNAMIGLGLTKREILKIIQDNSLELSKLTQSERIKYLLKRI